MGPDTIDALNGLLRKLARRACSRLVIATDADRPGERYAVRLTEMAVGAGVPAERVLPPSGRNDWNDALKARIMIPTRAWMRLVSGRRINLLDPQPDSWTDADLAIGLSRTYRWGGRSIWNLPLSVAQHGLLVLTLRERMDERP